MADVPFEPDLEGAQEHVAELGKAMDSLAFAPPWGNGDHIDRAAAALSGIGKCLGLRPTADRQLYDALRALTDACYAFLARRLIFAEALAKAQQVLTENEPKGGGR